MLNLEKYGYKKLRVGVLDTVQCFITPSNSLCSIILIPALNFGKNNLSPETSTNCGTVKLFFLGLLLNVGNRVLPR